MLLPQIFLLSGFGYWGANFDLNLLFALIIPIGFIFFLLLSFSKAEREEAILYTLSFFIVGILFIPSMLLTLKIRSYAFYLAGQRAETIIIAVEHYTNDNAELPKAIEELVPKYLDRLPRGIPTLTLNTEKHDGAIWSLSTDVPTGSLNWDTFIYRSDQNYSEYGAAAEKIGKWIYYHE